MKNLSENMRKVLEQFQALGCEFHFTHDVKESDGPTFFVAATYESEQIAFGQGFNYDQAMAAAYMEVLDFFRDQGRLIST